MVDKLKWRKFSEIDVNDKFFDSLREDYPDFNGWYSKKSQNGENALTLVDDNGIHAFLYLKRENEEIETVSGKISACPRLKIGTLKLDDTIENQRLGEGLIGVALWSWQKIKAEEIYVSAFEKQDKLIGLLQKFGFIKMGTKPNGECLLYRSRKNIDYSDPYKSFPFISPKVKKAGIIPINDHFHDLLFPYSETKFSLINTQEVTAGNGITKIYICSPYLTTHYEEGEPVFIHRKYNGTASKGSRSVVTSICTITRITTIKSKSLPHKNKSLNEYLKLAGNKTVFTEDLLKRIYNGKDNVVMIEMVYNGFFEKDNGIKYSTLHNMKLFEDHPYNIDYSREQMEQILKLGGTDVANIIID